MATTAVFLKWLIEAFITTEWPLLSKHGKGMFFQTESQCYIIIPL